MYSETIQYSPAVFRRDGLINSVGVSEPPGMCAYQFAYGLPKKEYAVVKALAGKLNMSCTTIDIKLQQIPFVSCEDAFIPARNLFLSIIGSWYGDRISISGLKGDTVEDNNPQAHKAMSAVISSYSRRQIEIFAHSGI